MTIQTIAEVSTIFSTIKIDALADIRKNLLIYRVLVNDKIEIQSDKYETARDFFDDLIGVNLTNKELQ